MSCIENKQEIREILKDNRMKAAWDICKEKGLYNKSLKSFYNFAKVNDVQYKQNCKYDFATLNAIKDSLVGCEKYSQVIEKLQENYGIYLSYWQLKGALVRFKIKYPPMVSGPIKKKNDKSKINFKDLVKECERIQTERKPPVYLLKKPIFE